MSDVVLIALIAAVPTTITSVTFGVIGIKDRRALKKDLGIVNINLDGRITQLLELNKKEAHAEGMKEEKDNNDAKI